MEKDGASSWKEQVPESNHPNTVNEPSARLSVQLVHSVTNHHGATIASLELVVGLLKLDGRRPTSVYEISDFYNKRNVAHVFSVETKYRAIPSFS